MYRHLFFLQVFLSLSVVSLAYAGFDDATVYGNGMEDHLTG
jgi:hypothetical protein